MDFTTPRLLLQYQEAVAGLNAGLVSRREFRAFVKGLRDQQVKLNRRAAAARAKREAKAEAERQRRLAEMARAEAAREAARRERRRERAEIRRDRKKTNVIFNKELGQDVFEDLVEIWKLSSQYPVLRVVSGGYDFQISHTPQSQDFIRMFFVGNVTDGTMKVNPGEKLLVVTPSNITAQRLRQAFREGISNCVFTPIIAKLESALESTQNKDRKTRLKQRINKLTLMSKDYESGVPIEAMESIAKASGYKITLCNKLQREICVFNENSKCGNIYLRNTRPNHLDSGYITLDGESTYISQSEMNDLWRRIESGEITDYQIEGDLKNGIPRKLHTLNTIYEVFNPNKEYFDAMDERINLQKCRLNATKYPEVNEFVKAGRIINAWITPFSDEKPTGYIDMPKAYTQFKRCNWYSGFLGVIHQFRSGSFDRKFLEEHIGIYQVRMKTSNPLFIKLGLTKSGFFGSEATTHILPSPEILYFMDNGVECEITAGVWGSRMDFDFPEDMLADRRYAIWSGRLSMEYHSKKYSFYCEKNWAEHIKADYGDDCFYWEDKKLCSVKLPIPQVYTSHHILAFITSYVRIQMIEAMKQFDLNQIVKVVLDGIFFKGDTPKCLNWFRPKEITQHSYRGFAWYNDVEMRVDWPEKWIDGNTLLTGQGGAGKTYKVLTDTGFNRILFVTPQHILGGDVSEKYSVSYTTIHKLIGEGCEPYIVSHAYPPVILVDEVTQISAEWIDRVFKMYKDSLILLAGDLNETMWFQTRNGRPGEFSKIWKPKDVNILEIGGDRRSKDDDLRELKLKIRDEMKRVFIDGDSSECMRMKMWAMKNLPATSMTNAVSMFQPGDVWIAGTNETSRKLLEAGVCSGWYKQGGFVSFEEKEGFDKRGSFTIHSFQGRTLETGRIFISLNDMFEFTMLYTAVSRAVEFKQLVFVGV